MSNTYQLYIREIENIPPLSKKAEQAYFQVWKEQGRDEARQKIYISNLRFVAKTAQRYKNQGVPLIDLINEGNLALDTALNRFDHTKKLKFISYAVWYIRQAMLNLLARQSRFVSITGAEAVHKANLNKAKRKLAQKLNRNPTNREMAKEAKFTIERVKRLEHLLEPSTISSLDKPVSITKKCSATLKDVIADDKVPSPDQVDNKTEIILKFMEQAGLNKQETNTITSYFGINRQKRNLEEIAFDYGVTRERMRQIKENALGLLKRFDRVSNKFNLKNVLSDNSLVRNP